MSHLFALRQAAIACILGLFIAVAWAGSPPVVPVEKADEHVGEYVTVVGRVANVFTSGKGNTFLNFGAAHPRQIFSATVFERYADDFDGLRALEGRRVRITGTIRLYQGKPQIILESPAQLAVD